MQIKTIKFIFFFLILSFIISTCKKEDQKTFVSGIVYDPNTHQPIEGADVLVEKYNEQDELVVGKQIVASLKTDANGAFNYEYIADESFEYQGIQVQKLSECYIDNGIYYGIKPEGRNYFKIEKRSEAWENIHIKNTSPFNSNDTMFYLTSYFPITVTPSVYPDTGMSVDYYQFDQSFQGGKCYLYLKWLVIKNNIHTIHYDSVYLTPCDTTNFNLFY